MSSTAAAGVTNTPPGGSGTPSDDKSWATEVPEHAQFSNREKYIPIDGGLKEALQCAVRNTHHATIQSLARAVIRYWSREVSKAMEQKQTELNAVAEKIDSRTATDQEINSYKITTAELAPFGITSAEDLQVMISLLKNDKTATDNKEGNTLLASALFCVANDKSPMESWEPTDTFDIQLLYPINDFFLKSITSESTATPDASPSTASNDTEQVSKFISRIVWFRFQRWANDVEVEKAKNELEAMKNKKIKTQHTTASRLKRWRG